jgi:predicted nuclease of restriction endonuclease-like RecB superfamily
MLSAEHVRVRRDKDRLVLQELSPKQRTRATELAEQFLVAAQAHLGKTRSQLSDAFTLVELRPSERRLAEGLKKLVEDATEFEQVAVAEPAALRSQVFLRAAAARRAATLEAPFERARVLSESAEALGLPVEELEPALYADLRAAHRVIALPALDAAALVAEYESAQVRALLTRAVSVVADVRCGNPDAYRALFQKLKFRQLLFQLEPLAGGGYRVAIDGPFSLFEAVTKYGLELAFTLPALEACDVLELTAKVLWGKNRSPLRFEYRHVTTRTLGSAASELRDDVRALLEEFTALGSGFTCSPAEEILDLPGVGLCVPDLAFRRAPGDEPVYLELLGYWSRDAVFRRLELVQKGLAQKIIFAASSKLRVSEAVFDGEHAALYVFRGRPSARAIERRLSELCGRS